MTEQSTKSLRLGVVAAILLGLVGTGFGIYQFVKEGSGARDRQREVYGQPGEGCRRRHLQKQGRV